MSKPHSMSAKDVISPARNFAAHKRNETKQNETNRNKKETKQIKMSRWQTQKQNEQKQKGEGEKWEQMEIKNFHTELKNEREGDQGG